MARYQPARAKRTSAVVSVTVLGAAATLMLSSCTASAETSGAGDALASRVEKNEQQWAMPLDEFIVDSSNVDTYAEDLLLGKCLTPLGYQWDVPWQPTGPNSPANVNSVGLKLFNVSIAQKWGYHDGPVPDPKAAAAWTEFVRSGEPYNSDPEFEKSFTSCLKKVRDPDSLRFSDGVNWIEGLKVQAGDVAHAKPAVRQSLKKWQKCVAAQYSFAVPAIPEEMPPRSLAKKFNLSFGVATTEEVELAVADAKCQESSGYTSAMYEAQWNAEITLLNENRDKLDRIRREAVAFRKKTLAVVASNAPKP